MNKRGSMMLRVLINRYNPKAGDALLKFLPQEEVDTIMALPIQSSDLSPILQQPQKGLARIHYSWIQPLLTNFPDALRPTVLAALTEEQIAGLQNPSPTTISSCAKAFVLNKLYDLLQIEGHFPVEYLPETDLSSLAFWTKQQILNLIDFLGLYDLASEVRHIVNPNYLKNIYPSLTPKQFHYLKICLHQKEQLIAPKLGIDLSKVETKKLKHILHKRGLIRLGRALCGQHSDLLWHISHTLDSVRGKLLLKEYHSKPLPKITSILKQQVLNLMNFLKSE